MASTKAHMGVLGTMTGHLQRSTNKKPVVRVARAAKMAEIPVEPVAPSVTHPTSPLTALECQTAVEVVKAKYGDVIGDVRFEMAMLEEPCKKALRAGVVPPRLARIHAYPGQKNFGILPGVYHGVVNVETEEVVAWQFLPEAMPMRGGSNWMAAMKLCKEDPRIVEALSRRGIDDMDRVVMEPWPTGPTAKTFENAPFDYSETDAVWKDELGKYTAYVHMWVRLDGDLDNYYAHPIDGLKAVIDVGNMDILAVEDTDDSIPIPMEMNNYAKQYLPENNPKVAPKPLEIIQPEGATFTVDEGNKLEWMGWDLTIGFNAREGLTLHSVAYTEPGTTERRPICYRASIAEMVVPYGSPNRGLWRKSVFDTGEAGLGKAVNSLELGCDCLGNIHYLDVPMVEEDGSVDIKKNAICIHEEDDGIMWKHKGSKGGKFASQVDMRRSTRLVISSISTVGNYEYGFFWRLTLDGQIECDVQATGIISTSACIPGQPEKYEYEVSRGVAGVTHQHTFCARLDMEVDGGDNTLLECDTIIPEFDGPGGENPYGNACYIQEHPVTTEGPRDINSDKLRYWRIINPDAKNALGQPTGFDIKAKDFHKPILHPDGLCGQRAAFIYAPIWVTPKSEGNLDLYPAGEFMSCNGPNEGLPEWIQQERDVSKEDLVIWHAFGLHHAARPEDFPVQNVVNCGFKLMPFGFFARNPVIDMAEPDHTSHGMSCHMNASGAGSTADDQIVSGGGGGR